MRFAFVLFALSLSGCMFSKKPAPAPTPVPVVAKPPAAEPPSPPVATVPEPPPAPPAPEPTVITTPATTPAKPKPVARKPKPAKPVQPPVAPSVHVPAPAPPPSPAPKLGELLTPAEQAEMNRTVDQSTAAARVTLSRLQGRKLTAEQADAADRIRTFTSQAEQARKTDLRTAAQLARRAAVLARDLEANLK